MIRKHVPPEPPPSLAGRKVRVHDTKGRSPQAVALLLRRARRVRAPPAAEMDRADGGHHRLDSSRTRRPNRMEKAQKEHRRAT
jgi:hypothetical protein